MLMPDPIDGEMLVNGVPHAGYDGPAVRLALVGLFFTHLAQRSPCERLVAARPISFATRWAPELAWENPVRSAHFVPGTV